MWVAMTTFGLNNYWRVMRFGFQFISGSIVEIVENLFVELPNAQVSHSHTVYVHITHAHNGHDDALLLHADAPQKTVVSIQTLCPSLLVVHAINNAFTNDSQHATLAPTNDFSTIPTFIYLGNFFHFFPAVLHSQHANICCWYHQKYGVVLHQRFTRTLSSSGIVV